jgi:hypothetical protein
VQTHPAIRSVSQAVSAIPSVLPETWVAALDHGQAAALPTSRNLRNLGTPYYFSVSTAMIVLA